MGLMTIGKYNNYDAQVGINPDFECLVNCWASVCQHLNVDRNSFEISMGMSGDFEHAVCLISCCLNQCLWLLLLLTNFIPFIG